MASYRVESRPGGPVGRLEVTRADLAPPDLRAWLADRLHETRAVPGAHEATGVAWCRAEVAVEDGRPRLTVRFGPHPAPEEWPRIPLAALLDHAVAQLGAR